MENTNFRTKDKFDENYFEKPQTSNINNIRHFSDSKTCLYFSKYNYCKFGNACKFLHSAQKNSDESKSHNKNQNSDEAVNQKISQRYQKPYTTTRNRVIVNKTLINQKQLYNPETSQKQLYKPEAKQKYCRYFKAGNCEKGDECPYRHAFNINKREELNNKIPMNNHVKKKRVPICHYFKKGKCQRGDYCTFYHQVPQDSHNKETVDTNISDVIDTEQNSTKNSVSPYVDPQVTIESTRLHEDEGNMKNALHNFTDQTIDREKIQNFMSTTNRLVTNSHSYSNKENMISFPIKKFYDLGHLSDKDIINLRLTEIAQLKKRYPKNVLSEESHNLNFTFEPSDPDWPFDLKSVDLNVDFPENYPIESCKIHIIPANNIPELLLRYLNKIITDWIGERHKSIKALNQVELVFRPFLKWFDKNLEDLFICGLRRVKKDIDAKRCGIEFVPVEALFPSNNETGTIECQSNAATTEINEEIIQNEPENKIPEVTDVKKCNFTEANASALKQGVKVLLNGFELVEGVATISCTKLALTVQCIRCKTSSNFKCIPNKNNTAKCTKCSKVMECTFNPSILHQFSNMAGNLHVVECQVVDVNIVECDFLVDCLNCTKQVPINGLHYGQKQKRWCTSCNEKLIFSIENIKFLATTSYNVASKNLPVKKVEKRKDPLIKEGEPLPDFGTCKHYKKSHRWLRFPCCGRLYPCDVCHDEKENDHEMKFASRMVCGLCSKEQPYSKEKPCISCSGTLTAKHATHWEGGKGCRNKIKMSRQDKHKYVGTSKTVSKKAEALKAGKKK